MSGNVSATNAVSARLIGAIFLERGLITEDQLKAALAIQVETKEHLGEILVQHFGVSRIELASVLAEQWAELERTNPGSSEATPSQAADSSRESSSNVVPFVGHELAVDDVASDGGAADEPAGSGPRPLGEILTEQGLVTDHELDRALATQKEGGEKLGEILVAQGSITRLQLASALAEQWTALRKIRPPSAEPMTPQAAALREGGQPAPSGASSADVEKLHEAVGALEQRLRAAEGVAAREPWREEIASAADELKSSVAEVETRVAATEARDEQAAVEEVRAALDGLSSKVEALSSAEKADDPELVRRVEAAAEAATAARSSLDGAFESLSLRLADVEARVHDRSDIAQLKGDLQGLADQVTELGGAGNDTEVAELRGEVQRLLDEVARRSTASAEPDPALANRVEKLTVRLEEIGSAVQGLEGGKKSKGDPETREKLGALASRIEQLEAGNTKDLQDLRRSVSELEARVPVDSPLAERLSHYGAGHDEIIALQERLAEMETRAEGFDEQGPALDAKLSALAGRLEALEGGTVEQELGALRGAIDELAGRPQVDPALGEQVARVEDRLGEVTQAVAQADDLREQVTALRSDAARAAELTSQIEGVRTRLDGLDDVGARLDVLEGDRSEAADLKAAVTKIEQRVQELAGRGADAAVTEELEALARRLETVERSGYESEFVELRKAVAELAARPSGDPALAQRVEELAREVEVNAGATPQLEALGARVGELARQAKGIGQVVDGLAELGRRVEELAGRPTVDAARIEKVEHDLARLTPVAGAVDSLRERIEGVSQELRMPAADPAEIERVAAKTTALQEQLTELRNRLDSIGEQAAEVDTRAEIAALGERVEKLSARPAGDPSLVARVDELAAAIESAAGGDEQLQELRARLDAVEEAATTESPDVYGPRLEALERKIDGLRVDDADAGTSAEVAELRERVRSLAAAVESSPDEPPQLDELRARLDAVEEAATTESPDVYGPRLEALERKIDGLRADDADAGTSAEVAELRERVRALAAAVESSPDEPPQLDELRARLDAVEKATTAETTDVHGPRIEELTRRLEETEAHTTDQAKRVDERIDERLEALDSRLGIVEELPAKIDALGEQLTAHESGHAKSVRKGDLTALRNDLAEQIGSMEERFGELASGARKDRESLEQKIDEIVAAVSAEVGGQRSEVDDRVSSVELSAEELRSEIAGLRGSSAEDEARSVALEADLKRHGDKLAKLEKLGKRLADDMPAAPKDVTPELDEIRGELASLTARLEGEDAITAAELETLKAELEGRLQAETARADAQLRATEDGLQAGLSSLGERLSEAEATYSEAGEALRASIERLGEAIAQEHAVEPDVDMKVADKSAAVGEPKGPFIAFVPNGSGYSLRELNGFVPVVGEPVPLLEADGHFVVTRIGRSPLPSDPRRCAYLERRAEALVSADRVP